MNNATKELRRRLLQELECPVCMQHMVPPIMLCNNGHNLCRTCRITLNKCPICKGPFLKVRNLSLEHLSSETLYRYKNIQMECTQLVTKSPAKHQASACLFESQKCPFAKISNTRCSWSGPMDTVKTHVENTHGGSCVQRVSKKFKSVLHNVSCSQRYYQAIITLDELFYAIWRVRSFMFYCAVFHIGPKGNASKYKYRLSISTKDGEEHSMSCLAHSYFENVNDIVRKGKCVILHYNAVQRSCNDKRDLPFRMEISQV